MIIPVVVTACSVRNDSDQDHETWSDTPDLPCKVRLSNFEILEDFETNLNHVPHIKDPFY